jgi:aminoglycoside 3-N-acetyltransferase I
MPATIDVRTLGSQDHEALRQMLAVFGDAFDDRPCYVDKQPSEAYLLRLLASDTFVAVAAWSGQQVVGALAGYVLPKFEQARAEFYLYDLAVSEIHRRQGVATALIAEMHRVCEHKGVYVAFVQADYGDDAAVALYTKLGHREDVMHFDLDPRRAAAALTRG